MATMLTSLLCTIHSFKPPQVTSYIIGIITLTIIYILLSFASGIVLSITKVTVVLSSLSSFCFLLCKSILYLRSTQATEIASSKRQAGN